MKGMAKASSSQSMGKKYSNLIFTGKKKVFPNRNIVSSCSRRSQSILILRGHSRELHRAASGSRQEQVLEVSQDQKMNVINLLKGNSEMVPKLKSHYCKKITLTNLDKYYEHCVNSMRSKMDASCYLKPGKNLEGEEARGSRQECGTLKTQQSEGKPLSFKVEGFQRHQFNTSSKCLDHNRTAKRICSRDHQSTSTSNKGRVFNFYNSTGKNKDFYSPFGRRVRDSSRCQTSRKEKDEFAINGWENMESNLPVQEDLIIE